MRTLSGKSRIKVMKGLKQNANVAIFVLFFGVSLLEAVQTQDWLRVGFWFAIGLVFLLADFTKQS